VTVTDGRGRPVRDGGLARWLAAVSPARVRGEIAVALVPDRHIRQLNREYRRKDAATDVLSFSTREHAHPRTPDLPTPRPPGSRMLGDIVIATGVAKRQAREAGHSYAAELRVLALHGLLHLLGYDHEAPEDRGRMARAEARLRRQGGLRQGLIGRATPRP
jgi:probable rRNA maturation factor